MNNLNELIREISPPLYYTPLFLYLELIGYDESNVIANPPFKNDT